MTIPATITAEGIKHKVQKGEMLPRCSPLLYFCAFVALEADLERTTITWFARSLKHERRNK
jgi:hypothetical protein